MARVELVMPKMGESIMEATILKWRKKPGDSVELDEAVLDIATDKVDSEIPSPVAGTLVEILFQENDVVPINKAIAIIETDLSAEASAKAGAANAQPIASPSVAQPTASNGLQETAAVPYVPVTVPGQEPASAKAMAGEAGQRFYSPLVRTIAKEEKIAQAELDAIPGSGQEGRVTKKDMLAYVSNRSTASVPTPTAASRGQHSGSDTYCSKRTRYFR